MTTRTNNRTLKVNRKTGFRSDQQGFTLVEVLISMAIFSVGLLGIMTSIGAVQDYQRDADDMTQATLLTKQVIERVKAVSANENALAGGSFGFDYLVGQFPVDELMTATSNTVWTFTENNIQNKFTRVWSLTVMDPNPVPGVTANFVAVNQPNIRFIKLDVTTTWTGSRGYGKDVSLSVVMNRREILQS